MEVSYFDSTLEKFILRLEKATIAKVLRTVALLERFGSVLGMPHSKKVAPQLFELRIRGRQEVRILYAFYKNNTAILLHGFIKKSERIPARELHTALQKLRTLDTI